MTSPVDERARYIMIGGFLGAGKTTAMAALARHLHDTGRRCGLITNDQSTGLVDSAILRAKGYTVEEIAGGCFCCRFESLSQAAERLTREAAPQFFLAEPVGSCTDLVATVSYPLRRLYGDRFVIAPLSVMVDPVRAERIVGLGSGRSFSPKVTYVYEKQLEEADLIVINKIDTLDGERQDRLHEELARRYPQAGILRCSARDGDGLQPWFEQVLEGETGAGPTMELDYRLYAEGEALLGWLNGTLRLAASNGVDGNRLLLDMARCMGDRLEAAGVELAHLKMTLDAADAAGSLAVVSLVRGDAEPDLRESIVDQVMDGELVVNLRAEADPEVLRAALEDALAQARSAGRGLDITLTHIEQFRPAPPVPTHRVEVVDDVGC